MLNSGEPTQIYSNSDKTPISPIPTLPNLGQIFIDPKESHPTLVRSGQIWQDPARFRPKTSERKTRNLPIPTRKSIRYDPTLLIWNFRRVSCESKSSPPDNVGSSPGWAQTRPVDTPRYGAYLLQMLSSFFFSFFFFLFFFCCGGKFVIILVVFQPILHTHVRICTKKERNRIPWWACLDWGGKKGRWRRVEESRVELAINKLILSQFFSTLLYSSSLPLNTNRPWVSAWAKMLVFS